MIGRPGVDISVPDTAYFLSRPLSICLQRHVHGHCLVCDRHEAPEGAKGIPGGQVADLGHPGGSLMGA